MGLSEDELVARAGTTAEQLERLTTLGIIFRRDGDRPFEPGSIQRVRLAEAIERSGIRLEDLARLIDQGRLSLSFMDLLFSDPVPYTGRVRSGLGEVQMRDLATQMSGQLLPVSNELVSWLYHRHQEHSIIEHLVEHIEAAMDAAGVARPRQARPPAMCFLDLTGYTALTEERGDDAAAALAASLAALVQETAQRQGAGR